MHYLQGHVYSRSTAYRNGAVRKPSHLASIFCIKMHSQRYIGTKKLCSHGVPVNGAANACNVIVPKCIQKGMSKKCLNKADSSVAHLKPVFNASKHAEKLP